MNRFERDELGTLFLRAIQAARDESAVLYATTLDMGEWTRTADTASTARREFWECLLRIEIQDVERPANRVVKVPSGK